MQSADILLRQLSRAYGRTIDTTTARDAIVADPRRLAKNLFDEAANSDDVTGRDAALAYLSARLDLFGGYIPQLLRSVIQQHFIECWDAWERVE